MKKLTLEQLRSLINEVLTEGDAPIMTTDHLKEIAAELTKAEKAAFLNARPYPPDGRVQLPSGRVLDVGSWEAAMELNTLVMLPQKKIGTGRGGLKGRPAWLKRALGYY